MSKIENYRQLEIWQMGMDVAKEIHRLTASFPKSEIYGLTSQMRRAAVSIPSNIAEGFVRRSRKDFRHFLTIALGSIAELETQVTLAADFDYFDREHHKSLLEQLDHLGRKITQFSKRLT